MSVRRRGCACCADRGSFGGSRSWRDTALFRHVRYRHRFYNFILIRWHLYAAVAAVAVNAGVQANHIVSQRAILVLNPEQANRANSLYVAIFLRRRRDRFMLRSGSNLLGWSYVSLVERLLASSG
jgi:hypothetical protein